MKKRIVAAMLLVSVFLTGLAPSALAANAYGFDLEVDANAVVLMNLDTGEVIYEKNADARVAPASTTKIMSGALAMELCADLDNTIVTVPSDIWNEFYGLNVSTANLQPGEELTMHELIYCMMLQSANEAASTVARYYGGDAFMQQMTDKAKALGCTDTYFSDPHGVFSMANGGNYTTARDMAKIAAWAVTVPGFWEITQQSRYDKRETNRNYAVTLTTTVLMQDRWSDYYTPYIRGIKTGTTDEAGRCLVSAAQKDGQSYLLVVLGAPFEASDKPWPDGETRSNAAFTETRLIYDWVFENLQTQNVVDARTIVADVGLKYAADRDTLLLYPDGEIFTTVNVYDEDGEGVRYECDIPDVIEAPVEAGQLVGTADVYFNDRLVGTTNLISRETVERSLFVLIMDNMTAVLTSTPAMIVYALLFLFVGVYLYYALVVLPRQQKRRQRAAARRTQDTDTGRQQRTASGRGQAATGRPAAGQTGSRAAPAGKRKNTGTRTRNNTGTRTRNNTDKDSSRYGDDHIQF